MEKPFNDGQENATLFIRLGRRGNSYALLQGCGLNGCVRESLNHSQWIRTPMMKLMHPGTNGLSVQG
jgi:hypothetical protein